eukprot:14726912-Ditylum_brightwellii.AAC.1
MELNIKLIYRQKGGLGTQHLDSGLEAWSISSFHCQGPVSSTVISHALGHTPKSQGRNKKGGKHQDEAYLAVSCCCCNFHAAACCS